jgi:hypothetical protein
MWPALRQSGFEALLLHQMPFGVCQSASVSRRLSVGGGLRIPGDGVIHLAAGRRRRIPEFLDLPVHALFRSILLGDLPTFGRLVGAVEGFGRKKQHGAGHHHDLAMPQALRDYAGFPSVNVQNLLPIGQIRFRPQDHLDGPVKEVEHLILRRMHLPFVPLPWNIHGQAPHEAAVKLYRQHLY